MSEPPDRPCRVVLVGMMGSGKTTVGRLLAEATGWPRFDNDRLLDQIYGMTAKQILEVRGEEEMRAAEDAALAQGISAEAPSIVDAAAGTILSPTSRELLREPIVVWLRASPSTLFSRAVGAAHRPWLEGGEEWVRTAAAEREPLYSSVADIVIDTDDVSPARAARELLSRLSSLCPELRAPES